MSNNAWMVEVLMDLVSFAKENELHQTENALREAHALVALEITKEKSKAKRKH